MPCGCSRRPAAGTTPLEVPAPVPSQSERGREVRRHKHGRRRRGARRRSRRTPRSRGHPTVARRRSTPTVAQPSKAARPIVRLRAPVKDPPRGSHVRCVDEPQGVVLRDVGGALPSLIETTTPRTVGADRPLQLQRRARQSGPRRREGAHDRHRQRDREVPPSGTAARVAKDRGSSGCAHGANLRDVPRRRIIHLTHRVYGVGGIRRTACERASRRRRAGSVPWRRASG